MYSRDADFPLFMARFPFFCFLGFFVLIFFLLIYLYVNILYFLLFHLSLSELSVFLRSFSVRRHALVDFQLFSQKSSGIPGIGRTVGRITT